VEIMTSQDLVLCPWVYRSYRSFGETVQLIDLFRVTVSVFKYTTSA